MKNIPEYSKTSLSLPSSLLEKIDQAAADDSRTRSGWIAVQLEKILQASENPAHTPRRAGIEAETTRLGITVGGWKRNALRHSFISYRAAQCGSLAQTALEAGNSEAEAKASYHSAMTAAEADSWFKIPPSLAARLNQICTQRGVTPFPVVSENPVNSRITREKLT